MKILLYGINFAPELTGIGKYTGEMAAWLAEAGHEVRVISAPPYYPEWKIWPGYTGSRWHREQWRGVTVFRAPVWVPQKVSGVRRVLHLISFALASIPSLMAQWRWRPELVWVTEPPLACTPAALLFAHWRGARSWLHIQDYEVDAAFDLGLLKGARVRAWISAAERWLIQRFDRVSTISLRMQARALEKGVPPARLLAFPNWVDLSAIRPLDAPSTYRAELGIARDSVVALYSGNMGAKQGLEILAEVANAVQADPGIQFVFCGVGPGRIALEAQCAHLPNVRFLDLQPLERLGDLLGLADLHLLPQRADAEDLVMPSKLTGMLASGRPVLATARLDTELGRVVNECGVVVPPGDAAALAAAIVDLAGNPERRIMLGAAARRHAEQHIARDAVLRQFERNARACVADEAAAP